jgi:hypothetical protein
MFDMPPRASHQAIDSEPAEAAQTRCVIWPRTTQDSVRLSIAEVPVRRRTVPPTLRSAPRRNNDPRIFPRILGVAEPIRFPLGSCSAMTELSESCVAQSFPR